MSLARHTNNSESYSTSRAPVRLAVGGVWCGKDPLELESVEIDGEQRRISFLVTGSAFGDASNEFHFPLEERLPAGSYGVELWLKGGGSEPYLLAEYRLFVRLPGPSPPTLTTSPPLPIDGDAVKLVFDGWVPYGTAVPVERWEIDGKTIRVFVTWAGGGPAAVLPYRFSVQTDPLPAGQFRIEVFGLDPRSPELGWQPLSTHAFEVAAFCQPTATRLCLNGSRFGVTATWETQHGETGIANALPLAEDTGAFWFFDEGNLEVNVKVLEACSWAGTYWVFAAGLTNVGVKLEVTDWKRGRTKRYESLPGAPFEPIQDVRAFTCP